MSDGWFGALSELQHYLADEGADTDCDGKFKVWGRVVVGIGGDEAVVYGDAEYEVSGKRCNLAAGLGTTSYGLRVGTF